MCGKRTVLTHFFRTGQHWYEPRVKLTPGEHSAHVFPETGFNYLLSVTGNFEPVKV
jgi:hypothetical protein